MKVKTLLMVLLVATLLPIAVYAKNAAISFEDVSEKAGVVY